MKSSMALVPSLKSFVLSFSNFWFVFIFVSFSFLFCICSRGVRGSNIFGFGCVVVILFL